MKKLVSTENRTQVAQTENQYANHYTTTSLSINKQQQQQSTKQCNRVARFDNVTFKIAYFI